MLVDPGSEGLLLLATLRGAGFEVELGTLADVATARCDVLVIAGDAPGSLTALRGLRDDGPNPDTKVVLVGAPPGMPLDQPGPSFGADWAISRVDAAEELVAAVRRVALASRSRAESPGLRERTLDLSSERSGIVEGDGEREPPSGEIEVHREAKSDPARVPSEPDGSSIDIAFDAKVSPALRELLHAADRRVFPHLPPVEPGLPRGESRARDLVPETLVLLPGGEAEEEPALDSLTFVGAVQDARPSDARRPEPLMPHTTPGLSARSKSVPPPPPEPRAFTPPPVVTPARTPGKTSPSVPGAKNKSATPVRLEPVRGEGGALLWLRALRPFLAAPCRLVLATRDVEATLVLDGGSVAELSAPLASRILEELEGVRSPEAEAEAALDLRARAGLLSPATRARLGERARRAVLRELLALSDVRFTIEARADASRGPRPFTRRFAPLLCELAGDRFDTERVFSLAGGEHGRLSRSPTFAEVIRECELPLEVELLFEREAPLASLIGELPRPGVLVVLLGLGGLEVRPSEEAHPLGDAAPALRERFTELFGRIEDADYFGVLGLPRSAAALDVTAAHAMLVDELGRVLAAHRAGDPGLLVELTQKVGSARAAIDEAHRVLSVDAWREAHRRALQT